MAKYYDYHVFDVLAELKELNDPYKLPPYWLVCDFIGQRPVDLLSLSNLSYLTDRIKPRDYEQLIVIAHEMLDNEQCDYINFSLWCAQFRYFYSRRFEKLLAEWVDGGQPLPYIAPTLICDSHDNQPNAYSDMEHAGGFYTQAQDDRYNNHLKRLDKLAQRPTVSLSMYKVGSFNVRYGRRP